MIKSNKGQIALEALVIFGILVVGSIIFGLFYMNNVRDILVEGPGTKQDKNGGGDIYDDLEGSLVYNEEEQIGSSSIGMSGGSGSGGTGGTDDPDDPDDPDPTYCGDGTCNGSETLLNCFLDCSAGYYVGGLYLVLTPEGTVYPTDKITINATLETDAPSAQISQINIQKFDYGNNSFNNSDDCGLTGYDNNYSYLNVGELLPIYDGYLNDSFDFYCNPGTYRFTFYVSNGTDTIENEVEKVVSAPAVTYEATILSPIVPGGVPFEYMDVHIPMYWLARVTDSLGNDLTESYDYTWAADWPEYGMFYNGDFDNDLMVVYSQNGIWYNGSISSGEYNLYVKASNGIDEIVSEGMPIISSGGFIILPWDLPSPAIDSVYTITDFVRLNTGLRNSDLLDYSNVSCNWYYHNLDTETNGEIALEADCLDSLNYLASDFGTGNVLIYVQLNAEDTEGDPVRDTRMSKIIIR